MLIIERIRWDSGVDYWKRGREGGERGEEREGQNLQNTSTQQNKHGSLDLSGYLQVAENKDWVDGEQNITKSGPT